MIYIDGLPVQDSPDVAVTASGESVQSENSVFIDPEDESIFSNDTILNTLYYPGINDVLAGEVKLLLRGFVEFGSAVNSMMLSIEQETGNVTEKIILVK